MCVCGVGGNTCVGMEWVVRHVCVCGHNSNHGFQ